MSISESTKMGREEKRKQKGKQRYGKEMKRNGRKRKGSWHSQRKQFSMKSIKLRSKNNSAKLKEIPLSIIN